MAALLFEKMQQSRVIDTTYKSNKGRVFQKVVIHRIVDQMEYTFCIY